LSPKKKKRKKENYLLNVIFTAGAKATKTDKDNFTLQMQG
jgi:hypothetical protein